MQEKAIKCPKCGAEIDVQSVVYQQVHAQIKQEYHNKEQQLQETMQQRELALEQSLKSFQAEKQALDATIQERVQNSLLKERISLKESIKAEIAKEHQGEMEIMQKELEEKSHQLQELHSSKAEIARLRRENSEIEQKIHAKAQEQLTLEMEKFRQKTQQEFYFQLKEKDKTLEDLKRQLQESQRKINTTSQQLQGEVQELAIEEYLRIQFPLDQIEEIKKGQGGGDCLQIVHTLEAQSCGKIYYESKRTKYFQKEWIEKLKQDMRYKQADVGVIVTEALPKDWERMGLMEGIWVCRFDEFKALSLILRESVIRIFFAKRTTQNKEGKMQMLYDYLTSSEFKMHIEAIVEGFTQMQSDLEREKNAMQKLWKQREKQIQKVLEGSIGIYGSFKGIAGGVIANIPALDLDAQPLIGD